MIAGVNHVNCEVLLSFQIRFNYELIQHSLDNMAIRSSLYGIQPGGKDEHFKKEHSYCHMKTFQ